LRFHQGADGDFNELSERCRPEAAESFGQIAGYRCGSVSNLIAEPGIVYRLALLNQRLHFALEFVCQPPGVEIFKPSHSHTIATGRIRSVLEHAERRTEHDSAQP